MKISGLVLVILLIGSILMVPVKVQENYEATESYTEKEPYTDIETYYVKEPYTVYAPLSYMVLSHRHYDLIHRDYYTPLVKIFPIIIGSLHAMSQ